MNVYYDMRPLQDKQLTGIGKYTYNLYNEVIKIKDTRIFSIGKNGYANKYIDLGGELPVSDINFSNQIISLKTDTNNIDIIHSTYYPIPINTISKKIITIHDLIALKYPEYFCSKNVFDFFDKEIRRCIGQVDYVSTVSNATRKDIVELYNVDPSKVVVVNPGINEKIKNIEALKTDVFSIYNIDKPYMLCVATLEPRKNLVRVIKAYNMFRDKNKEKLQLVLVGKKGWKFNEIVEEVNKSKYRSDIIITEYINDNDVVALYSKAYIFIYASLCEGFGLPLLEAMCFSVPIITSNVSSMPEVCGNAACYCNPKEVESIYESIEKVFYNDAYRKSLIYESKIQKEKFSYKRAANETVRLYKKCMEELK